MKSHPLLDPKVYRSLSNLAAYNILPLNLLKLTYVLLRLYIPGVILFATDGAEGIRAYSELTLTRVRTLICNSNPGEDGELVEGLTFDWINGRIYWASGGGIYTANERGTDLKQVFNSTECESTLIT